MSSVEMLLSAAGSSSMVVAIARTASRLETTNRSAAQSGDRGVSFFRLGAHRQVDDCCEMASPPLRVRVADLCPEAGTPD